MKSFDRIAVAPLEVDGGERRYDLCAVALGYEERARWLVENCPCEATHKVAWTFDTNQVLSFNDNKRCFESAGFSIAGTKEDVPRKWLEQAVLGATSEAEFRVCIDVSSITRRRLALWLDALRECTFSGRIVVEFYYCPSEFTEAPGATANTWAGPVTEGFAGWSSDPELPSYLIIGLGYEPDRAAGAIEYIEPAEVILFEPVSHEPRFTPAIKEANRQLWTFGRELATRRYSVEDPLGTFVVLERLVKRLASHTRPILLPFGPKLFALNSMLVAMFYPAVAVWRVSGSEIEIPVQRRASGGLFGLRVTFERMDLNQPE